jgi:hypothetical protein
MNVNAGRRLVRAFWTSLKFLFLSMLSVTALAAGNRMVTLEVSITNVMRGAVLTPPLVANTRGPVSIFELGQPASDALEQLAEGGATAPLAQAFSTVEGA